MRVSVQIGGEYVSEAGDLDVIRYNRILTFRNAEKRIKQINFSPFVYTQGNVDGSNYELILVRDFERSDGGTHKLRISCNFETEDPHSPRLFTHVGGRSGGLCKLHLLSNGSWVNFGIPNTHYNQYEFNGMLMAIRRMLEVPDSEIEKKLHEYVRFEVSAGARHMGYINVIRNILTNIYDTGKGFTHASCHAVSSRYIGKHYKDRPNDVLMLTVSTNYGAVEHSFVTKPDMKTLVSDSMRSGKIEGNKYTTDNSKWTLNIKYAFRIGDLMSLQLGSDFEQSLESLENLIKE